MRLEALILLVWAFAVGCGTEVGNGFNTGDDETQARGDKKSPDPQESADKGAGEGVHPDDVLDSDKKDSDTNAGGGEMNAFLPASLHVDALMTACGSPFKGVMLPVTLVGGGGSVTATLKDGGVLVGVTNADNYGPYQFQDDETIDLGHDSREVPYVCEEAPKATPQADGSTLYTVWVVPKADAPDEAVAQYLVSWTVMPSSKEDPSLIKLEVSTKAGAKLVFEAEE